MKWKTEYGMEREGREGKLRDLYENSPAAFSTPERLRREARKHGILISLPQLTKLMSQWQTFTKFRVKYKKPRLQNKIIVSGPSHLFQIDLAILPKYRNYIGLLVWFYFSLLITYSVSLNSLPFKH